MYTLGCHIMPGKGDGFCFLNAIYLVLYCDHNEVVTFDSLASIILGHLVANFNYYEWFHIGYIIKNAENYFKFGSYCEDVLNVTIIATAKSLQWSLSIYQKWLKGKIQILKHVR